MPTWIVHGEADDIVPVSYSDRMAAALEAVGAPVRYTRYRDVEHDAWTRTYTRARRCHAGWPNRPNERRTGYNPVLHAMGAPPQIAPSPFHAKGQIYRNLRLVLDEMSEGGYASVIEPMAAEIKAFGAQQFLPSSWYDYVPFDLIVREAARRSRREPQEFSREAGQRGAAHDLGGIYRVFLKLTSVRALLQRLEKLTAQYYNFSPLIPEVIGPNHASFERREFPAMFTGTYLGIAEGYVKHVMHLAGAREIDWRQTTRPAGVHPDGYELIDVRWDLLWK